MIIEFLINAIIAIIKLPLALLNIPQFDGLDQLDVITPYLTSGYSFVRFLLNDASVALISIALTVLALIKVADIIGTIVGFFKKR
ncbi:MAG: hypothetical protein LUH82_03765 [Clostridiales bacterium]|nr:hypothetical protein [Clostridiales bacterium]